MTDHLFMLNHSVKQYLGDLWNHLDNLGINTDFIFEKAFLSIYSNFFERELLYRIWDVIFLEISRKKLNLGWVLISIALAILSNLSKLIFEVENVHSLFKIIKVSISLSIVNLQLILIFKIQALLHIWSESWWLHRNNICLDRQIVLPR